MLKNFYCVHLHAGGFKFHGIWKKILMEKKIVLCGLKFILFAAIAVQIYRIEQGERIKKSLKIALRTLIKVSEYKTRTCLESFNYYYLM